MIFILILVVMIVASIIRVPDVVNGRVKITQPENPQPGSDASSVSISGNASIRYTGLLKKGQKVLIDLDAYPASQNGTIEGRLEEIQPLASDEKVSFRVSLPNGFVTDRHTIIPVQPVLNGGIQIVVSETSILKKLLPF
ncbi:MAG: hypothetical protein JNM88_12350 [Chitinophagaceae bacterium]|nr:hypothetical protein [Chitinophagaceae bacterium]